MPEHATRQTSLERLEDAVNKLTQHQASLAQNHQTLAQANADLHSKLDSVIDSLACLTANPPPSPKPPPSPPAFHNPRPHMKLEVPRFDGQDPLGWIFKIQQFFDNQASPTPSDSPWPPSTWRVRRCAGSSGCLGMVS